MPKPRKNKPEKKAGSKKVLVALSGGIDSAVSTVLLLRKGYQVEAAFMKNWSSTEGLVENECPWIADRREALRVAAFLRIPLHTFDFEKQYQEKVMKYFFDEYAAGRTPNPDVMCNKEIKFKLLYDKAMAMGFDFLATGHYAQIKNGMLLRSKDEFKDQTYFIYNLKKEQLKHLLFPVGGFLKQQVRQMAKKFGLPNAERKESMGLCFIGKIHLDKFLKQRIPEKSGNIIDRAGQIIGTHSGIARYTLGQREGLKIGGNGPFYVVKKELKTNTLIVSKDFSDQQLMADQVQISGMHWIIEPARLPMKCYGRFRHQQDLQQLEVSKEGDHLYSVKFAVPQRAVASGQSLVLYTGKTCIGGGVIV